MEHYIGHGAVIQSYESDTDSESCESRHGQKRTKSGQIRRKKSQPQSQRRRHSDSTVETIYETQLHRGYAIRNSFRGYNLEFWDPYNVYPDPEASIGTTSTTPLARDPKWKKLIKPKICCYVLVVCFIGLVIGTVILAELRYQETVPIADTVSAQLELTLDNTFNEKYEDTSSQEFIQLEKEFCDQMRTTYRRTGSTLRDFYDSCSIETVERGSIRITFRIILKRVISPISKEKFVSVLYLNIKRTKDGYGDFGNLKIIMTSVILIKVFYNPSLTSRVTTPTTPTTTTPTTTTSSQITTTVTTATSQTTSTTTLPTTTVDQKTTTEKEETTTKVPTQMTSTTTGLPTATSQTTSTTTLPTTTVDQMTTTEKEETTTKVPTQMTSTTTALPISTSQTTTLPTTTVDQMTTAEKEETTTKAPTQMTSTTTALPISTSQTTTTTTLPTTTVAQKTTTEVPSQTSSTTTALPTTTTPQSITLPLNTTEGQTTTAIQSQTTTTALSTTTTTTTPQTTTTTTPQTTTTTTPQTITTTTPQTTTTTTPQTTTTTTPQTITTTTPQTTTTTTPQTITVTSLPTVTTEEPTASTIPTQTAFTTKSLESTTTEAQTTTSTLFKTTTLEDATATITETPSTMTKTTTLEDTTATITETPSTMTKTTTSTTATETSTKTSISSTESFNSTIVSTTLFESTTDVTTTDTSTATAVSTTEIPIPTLSMKGITLQPFTAAKVQCRLTNLYNWDNITILKNDQFYAITFSNGSTVQFSGKSKVTFYDMNNNATVTLAFEENLSHCEEGGQYTCIAIGAWGTTTVSDTVTVSVSPQNITLETTGPYDEGIRRILAVCHGFVTPDDTSIKLMMKKTSDSDFKEFIGDKHENSVKKENNQCVLNANISYSFVPSSEYNGTQVKCVAVNRELGLTVSSDVKVIVVTMRDVSFNKYDHEAKLGSFIESTCTFTSPTWYTLKIIKLDNTNKIILFNLDKVNGLSVSSSSPRVAMTSQDVTSNGVKFSFNFTTVNCTDAGQYRCVVNDSIAELESPTMTVAVTRSPKVKSFKLSAHQTVSYNRPEYKHTCTGDPGYPAGKFRIAILKPNTMEYTALPTTGGVYDVAEGSWNCESTEVTWMFLIKFESDMDGGTVLCIIENTKETSSENATIELIPDDFCQNIGINVNVLPHPSNCHWYVECYGDKPTGRPCTNSEQCYVSPPSSHFVKCIDCGTDVCLQDVTTTSTTVSTTLPGPFRIDCNDTTEYIGSSPDIICKVLSSKFDQIDVKKSSNQQSVAIIANDGTVTNSFANSPRVHLYADDQGTYLKISFINITCEDDGGYQLALSSGNNSFTSKGNLNVQALPTSKPSVTVDNMAEGSSAKFICTGDVGNPEVGVLAIDFWDTKTSSFKRETTTRAENEYKQCTNIKKVAFDKVLKSEMNGTAVRCITTYTDLSNTKKTLTSSEHTIIVIPVSICGVGERYVKHPYDCRKHITCDVDNNRIFEQSCNPPYCINIKTGQCDALCDCGETEGVTKYDCAYYRSGEWRIPRQDTYPDKCKTYKWCYNGGTAAEEIQCTGNTYVHKASNGSDYCTMTYSESYCAKKALTDNRTTTTVSTISTVTTPASEFDCATYPNGQWRIQRNDTYPNRCRFYTWCSGGKVVGNQQQCPGETYFNKATQEADFCVSQYSASYCARQAGKTTTAALAVLTDTTAGGATLTESISTDTAAAGTTTTTQSTDTTAAGTTTTSSRNTTAGG